MPVAVKTAEGISKKIESESGMLDVAMGIQASRPQISEPDENQCCKLLNPGLPAWSDVIDESVRRVATGGRNGPVPLITFSSDPFLLDVGGRMVFRTNPNIEMIHLGHPLMSQALNTVGQRRYPGGKLSVSRWTSRFAEVPSDCDALILLHLEEIGVNELRETFHHWVRTILLPLRNGVVGAPLPHCPADQLPKSNANRDSKSLSRASEWLSDLESELQLLIKTVRVQLTDNLKNQLSDDGKDARKEEDRLYQSRHGEVSALIESNTVQKLEREIQQLVAQKNQGMLFDNESYLDDLNRDIKLKQQEVEFRRKHYEEVRDQLARERDRVVNRLLPKRFTFHGEAQVFPLAVEIYLPFPKGGVQ